jgi:hypothetical protein
MRVLGVSQKLIFVNYSHFIYFLEFQSILCAKYRNLKNNMTYC